MIYLDTHVVIWFYYGRLKKISNIATEVIKNNDLYIAEMVRLELQYLHEIGRIDSSSSTIIETLRADLDLKIANTSNDLIINQAIKIDWTRDVFDRLIVAQAMVDNATLITKIKPFVQITIRQFGRI